MAEQTDRRFADEHVERSSWRWIADEPGTIPVTHVRGACRAHLERFATPDSDIAGAELILAELLANVVRHALGVGSFHLDWSDRRPNLLVLDSGPGFAEDPRAAVADPYAECGRGFAIVQALALRLELGNRAEGGGFVLVTLPVERRLEAL